MTYGSAIAQALTCHPLKCDRNENTAGLAFDLRECDSVPYGKQATQSVPEGTSAAASSSPLIA
ncbi:hypothetical protein [Trichormus variabilis]|uniref:hypothetical protein n=1 Tax=Anabaena variabilis TaxID=264691 RepID=UPI000F8DFB93|nr:hypothetical protein [Trichormus variabilis]MBD2629254.1 hypothetical protein [Trichormus variabilis FACHB-164]